MFLMLKLISSFFTKYVFYKNIIKFVIDFIDANNAKNKVIFNVYKKDNDKIKIFNFRIALILKSKKNLIMIFTITIFS